MSTPLRVSLYHGAWQLSKIWKLLSETVIN
ncbi:BnaC09g17680D [Brassica napus]|uniref:BnaC09g17680D protein n=1 Tax=Brassica napus TaxID=3708 RepID=A0A078HGJ1_BRANA|nr:BnaC09g17680D [Brassica napus]